MKTFLIALVGVSIIGAENQDDTIRVGITKFSKDVSKLLSETYENVLFSPLSSHAVLSMLYQGAGGTTKEALAAALHIPDPIQTAQAYETVLINLRSDNENINISIADKIYVKPGHTLNPEFTDMVKNHFHSEVQSLDFSQNAEAAREINSWVEKETNNKISDLLHDDDLDVDTRIVLANAFYFKGNWLNVFDKDATEDGDFHVNEETTVQVPMMSTSARFMYEKNSEYGAEIIGIPFENTYYFMTIVIPFETNDINDLLKKLSEDGSTFGNSIGLSHIELTMPKFKLSVTTDMQELLEKLGLSELFSASKCDLTNMFTGGEDIYISKAVQKTYISVDEFGCEVSAASGIVGEARTLPEASVTVDRPFLIALGHSNINRLADQLLIGRVVNPATNDI